MRSVSGFEIYRKVYRDVIRPERVAEDPQSNSCRSAGKLKAEIQYARIEEILQSGLHAFLLGFLTRVNQIGRDITSEFLAVS